jgi:hypothetical protein
MKRCIANGMKLFNIAHRRMTGYGRSAVSISSLANGALGEHRRHETHELSRVLEVPEPQPIGSAFEPEIEIPQ